MSNALPVLEILRDLSLLLALGLGAGWVMLGFDDTGS